MLSAFLLLISGTISYFYQSIGFLFLLFFISILYIGFLYNNYYDNTIISDWLLKNKMDGLEVINDYPHDPLSLALCNYILTILSFAIIGLIYFSYRSQIQIKK